MLDTYPDDVLKRLQEELLDILLVLDEICKNNDLPYFINGGTLLGAIRHGGFIPWDDDIDIGLLHEDYLKFVDVAKRELPEGYVLCLPESIPNQTETWAKVIKKGTRFIDTIASEAGFEQGIFVDVFDFREFDADPKKAAKQVRGTVFWQRMSYLRCIANPHIPKGTRFKPLVRLGLRATHALAARFFSQEMILKNFEKAWQADTPGGQWIDCAFGYRKPYPTDVLLPVRPIEFCGKTVLGPNKPEVFLQTLFGDDYMQLPPVEDRHNHTPLILDFGDGVNVMEG